MVAFKLSAIALLLLQSISVFAADVVDEKVLEEEVDDPTTSGDLKVMASVSFPHSEIFGVKLVNGHPTQAVISYINEEPEPVTVLLIGGSLNTVQGTPQIVRNLTMQRFGIEVPAGEKQSINYSFATELHPQDLRLQLTSIVKDSKDAFYTIQVFNETVSVVEAPTSIFDPQIIFLYLILAALFGGTCYFIYNTWFTTLFPQKRRGGKGGDRRAKKTEAADPAAAVDGATVITGSKVYDESWIPAQHLARPEAKRVGSGRSTPKTKRAA